MGFCLASSLASAQIPDIRANLDLTFSYRVQPGRAPYANFYSYTGRPSILGLSFYTEQGFRALVSEKLQRIPGDPNSDLFDEYYLEDERIWRIGKQYLPFGSGRLLRESALAAKGDTNLIFEGLPLSIAICDSGKGLDSGVIGRLGSVIGFSVAVGRHFGASGTALTTVRRPEDAPGQGFGWKQAYGIDAARRIGHLLFRAEAISLRYGETPVDKDTAVFDFSVSLDPKRGESMTIGWSRILPAHDDYIRLAGSFAIVKNLSFEPSIRFKNNRLFEISAELRIKI